jgi:23S rRNA pseudouridine1911/1915/1917 synthase
VLIAKDRLSGAKLYQAMKDRKFGKTYLAIVEGVPSESHGIINAPIVREAEGSIKRVVREDGKRAVTEYQVLKELDGGNSLCEITLHTGRTHQIRVHMAYIGHPLYADFLYGERIEGQNYLLHAKKITFIHPITEEPLILESKADFE